MKKWILFVSLTLALFSKGWASVSPPLDRQGHALPSVDFVGAIPCNIDVSTGTNVILCGAAGAGIVYGVIASSIAATDFITFRDTNTANVTSTTATVVFAAGTGSNSSGASTTQTIKFPVPLKFSNGICVLDATAPAGRSNWTILYRPQTAGE